MAEEGRPRPWVLPRLSWATVLRLSPLLLLLSFAICFICCVQFQRSQQTQLEPLEVRVKGKEGKEALGCSGGDPTGAGRVHLEDAPECKDAQKRQNRNENRWERGRWDR